MKEKLVRKSWMSHTDFSLAQIYSVIAASIAKNEETKKRRRSEEEERMDEAIHREEAKRGRGCSTRWARKITLDLRP